MLIILILFFTYLVSLSCVKIIQESQEGKGQYWWQFAKMTFLQLIMSISIKFKNFLISRVLLYQTFTVDRDTPTRHYFSIMKISTENSVIKKTIHVLLFHFSYPLCIDEFVAVRAVILIGSVQRLRLDIGVLEGIFQTGPARQSHRDVLKLLLSLTHCTTALTLDLEQRKKS